MDSSSQIAYRPYRPTDAPYIIKSWVRSLEKQFPYSEMSPAAVGKMAKRIEALLAISACVVACDPVNDDVIYGFACGSCGRYLGVEAPTLHYVWVRRGQSGTPGFRHNGIGTALVKKLFPSNEAIIYTHITKAIHHAGLKEKWNLKQYDPYFIEGALYAEARSLDAYAALGRGGAVL
jgi:hypothetical protein